MFSIVFKSHGLRKNTQLIWAANIIRFRFLTPPLSQFAEKPNVNHRSTCGGGGGAAKHSVTYKSYQPPVHSCHDAKNMALKRPMSPHLTIYAPTLPAMTSIVQRITGIILVAYTVLLAFGSLFLSNGVETYVSIIQSLNLSRPSIFLIKILLGAPFTYHYFNGIRFCMWNACKWLNMKEVYFTAKMSFIATAILTTLFALL